MAITWAKTRKLTLRTILTLSYTLTFTLITGVVFSAIYLISEDYQVDEFNRRLKDRTLTTFTVLLQVDQIDRELLQIYDRNIINSLSDEKILLFDSAGALIYNSIGDSAVKYPSDIISRLRRGETEVERKAGDYEVVGISFRSNGKTYFGIAQAYDRYGKSKLRFLKNVLIISFVAVAVAALLLSLFLSKIITAPISRLTQSIETISPDNLSKRLPALQSMAEVSYLAARFNGLLDKVENAFKFQYHFIHHISHELKTPLAVMLANAERALTVNEQAVYEASLGFQKHALMELSHIINAMLEISKTEHSLLPVQADQIRVDELLFACMEELNFLHEKVQFDFRLDNTIEHADSLTVTGSTRMLKMAFMNLLKNAILYATDGRPVVELMPVGEFIQINVLNGGPLITDEDRDQLFRHFFRGENSRHVKGFGLGLVLVRRIVELHKGQLFYSTPGNSLNCFTIRLPRLS